MLGVRLALDVAVWLKEFAGGVPDRQAEDARERSMGYRARRAAGGLTDHALYPIVVDGEFGPQTATATRVFQASTDGLAVDGLVTDADRVAIENAIDALGG